MEADAYIGAGVRGPDKALFSCNNHYNLSFNLALRRVMCLEGHQGVGRDFFVELGNLPGDAGLAVRATVLRQLAEKLYDPVGTLVKGEGMGEAGEVN